MILKFMARASLLLAAACFLLGAGATVIDVLLRALAGRNLPGVIEFTTLTIGLGALLSMPVCYLRDTHVTARLLSEVWPQLFCTPLAVVGAAFSLLFSVLLALTIGLNAAEKWGGPETTSDLQLRVYWLLAIVAVTFAIAIVAAGFRLLAALKGSRIDG
jgi:TRAP-type C4-dicarboxylate transport system permease small subunit